MLAVALGLLAGGLAAPPAQAATSTPMLQPPQINKVSVPPTPQQVVANKKAYVEPDMAYCRAANSTAEAPCPTGAQTIDPSTGVATNTNNGGQTRVEMYESVGNNDNSYKWDWNTLDEFSYLVSSVPKTKNLWMTIYNTLQDGYYAKRVTGPSAGLPAGVDQFRVTDTNGGTDYVDGASLTGGRYVVSATADGKGNYGAPSGDKTLSVTSAFANALNKYDNDAQRRTYIHAVGGADTMGSAFDAGSSAASLLWNNTTAMPNGKSLLTANSTVPKAYTTGGSKVMDGAGVMTLCQKNGNNPYSKLGTCLSTDKDLNAIYHSKYAIFEQAADSTGRMWDYAIWVTSSNLNGASGGYKANTSFAIFGDKLGYQNLRDSTFLPAINQSRTTSYNGNSTYDTVAGAGVKSTLSDVTYYPSPGAGGGMRPDWEGKELIAKAKVSKSSCQTWVIHSRFSTVRTDLVNGLVAMKKSGCAVKVMLDINNAGDVTSGYFAMGKTLRKLIGNVILDNVHDKTVAYRYTDSSGNVVGAVYGGSANGNGTSLTYDELDVRVSALPVVNTVIAQDNRLWAIGKAGSKQVLVKSLALSPSSTNIPLKSTVNGVATLSTLTLTPVFTPSNATIKNVAWSVCVKQPDSTCVENPTIATVSPSGVVTLGNAAVTGNVLTVTAVAISGTATNASSGYPQAKATATITITDKVENRLYGAQAVDTAIQIAKAGWGTTTGGNLLIATASTFPDALAGGPLAYQLQAPILLTLAGKSGALESTVKAQIQAMHPSKIWVLGGTSVVGTPAENQLRTLAPSFQRVWGTTKYDTAVEIARELAKQQGQPNLMAPAPAPTSEPTPADSPDASSVAAALTADSPDPTADSSTAPTDAPMSSGGSSFSPPPALGSPAPGAGICGVFVVSGDNFPDALSVSPVASRLGTPILLTSKTGTLQKSTHDYLARVNAAYVASLDPGQANVTTACVVGGTVAVPPAVDTALSKLIPTVKPRIAGASKYDTNVAVNAQFASLFTGPALTFATGENFPDALTGGAFSAKGAGYALPNKAYPFFLIPPSASTSPGTKAAIAATGITTAYVFGGPVALTEAMVDLHFA